MTTTTATRKTTKKQENRTAKLTTVGTAQVLGLTTGKDTVFYLLQPLAATVGAGFRLCKADRGDGPGEEYDVLLDGQFSSCECKGFLRWNHCKHVEALTALVKSGKITAPTVANKPEPQPEPEEEETVYIGEEPPQPAKCCFECGKPSEGFYCDNGICGSL